MPENRYKVVEVRLSVAEFRVGRVRIAGMVAFEGESVWRWFDIVATRFHKGPGWRVQRQIEGCWAVRSKSLRTLAILEDIRFMEGTEHWPSYVVLPVAEIISQLGGNTP